MKKVFYYLLWFWLILLTLAFFIVEALLPEGWYYIPAGATRAALVLCVIWQGMLLWETARLIKRIKAKWNGTGGKAASVFTGIVTACIVLVLAKNFILYSLDFDEKVEQYDEHIALYVDNTFVRTRFRNPHYRYEENWLLMRKLSDEQLQDAIEKYGDPEEYYEQ